MLLRWCMVHELGYFRHKIMLVLICQVIASFISRSLLCLCLQLLVLLLLLLFLSEWFGCWFDLRLHLKRLVTTFLFPSKRFLLHKRLHAPVLILEENFVLVQIWHLVLLLSPWSEILGLSWLLGNSLSFSVSFAIFLLDFLYHLLLRLFVEIRTENKIDLLVVVGEFGSQLILPVFVFRIGLVVWEQSISFEVLRLWFEEDFSFGVDVIFVVSLILSCQNEAEEEEIYLSN